MGSTTVVIAITIASILALAILCEYLAPKIKLPASLLLLCSGCGIAHFLVMQGVDLQLRWQSFHDIVLFIFVPVLVFESALSISLSRLLKELPLVLILAIPLYMLMIGLTAAGLYYGIDHPTGFPWLAALLCATLVSATDPTAVLALMKQAGIPTRITLLVEGESLFNDGVAIVLYSVLIAMALSQESMPARQWHENLPKEVLLFGYVFFGGALLGAGLAWISAQLYCLMPASPQRSALTLVLPYLGYIVAELVLDISGVMAVLVCGLGLGRTIRRSADSNDFNPRLWGFFAFAANAAVFVLVGITITLDMFTERWLAILIGIAAALLARAFMAYACVPLVTAVFPIKPVKLSHRHVLFWGGVRGPVALALVLALPLKLDYWFTVQSIVYGVAVFTLLIQVPTFPLLIRKTPEAATEHTLANVQPTSQRS